MKERKSLPESELDIMLVVWKAEGPISAPKIMEIGRASCRERV